MSRLARPPTTHVGIALAAAGWALAVADDRVVEPLTLVLGACAVAAGLLAPHPLMAV